MNFLYSVTVGIDKDIEQEWLVWMKQSFFERVMGLGIFSGYKIYKVLTHDDENSVSYNIQYHCHEIEKIVYFLNHEGKTLMEEHRIKFKDKHVVFNTLLQEV
ncbi:MAG: hypothetical protein OJF59_000967 [Cytophagales bacterium]|jgi:hypothetical protein|nr:DUF4286 family protein [Bacteroidota bacterium]MBS1980036.1 DUF4286 family protein [Bacteroidota bacterium]WHZ07214.1 MAG: hypothetical protein OJF59_000967 [Cytophagales bacterium]